MTGDGGLDERPGVARRAGTAVAVLLLVGLAATAVRQATRALPGGGGSGELQVHAGADRATAPPALPPAVAGTWEVLPRAELSARADPVAVWTGREVFLWGGRAGERTFSDGSLYDPSNRSWSPIHVGPPQRWQEGVVGLWTGQDVVLLGGERAGVRPVAQAYSPDRGAWRPLSPPPRGPWLWRTAVWTGTHAVVLGTGDSGGAVLRYDPAQDHWERGGSISTMSLSRSSRAAWAGGQMVVSGTVPGSTRLVLQAFDPLGTAWRRGRGAPVAAEWRADVTADPETGGVLLAGPAPADRRRFLAARWLPTGGWQVLPEVPAGLRGRLRPRVFATRGGPLLWPDEAVPPSLYDGAGWRPLPRAPMDKRSGEAVVWTHQGLFVWGGQDGGPDGEPYDSGALYRPAPLAGADADAPGSAEATRVEERAGAWEALPALPALLQQAALFVHRDTPLALVRSRGSDPRGQVWRLAPSGWERAGHLPHGPGDGCTASLGGALVQVGPGPGPQPARWTATRLDLGTERTGGLPEPPLPAGGVVRCAPWGSGLAVVRGAGDGYAAALLDAESGTWSSLPQPPLQGLFMNVLPAGEDSGAPLLGLTDLTVARLEPDGQWSFFPTPRNHFAPFTPAVAWAGDRLLVWGGVLERPVHDGWSWDAGRNRWKQIPPAWFGGAADAMPHVWTGVDWVLWGQRETHAEPVQDAGVYTPATGRWSRLPSGAGRSPVMAAAWHHGVVVLRADGTVQRLVPAESGARG